MSYRLCWLLASGIMIPLASSQHILYDIYHCCVYSARLLVMDRETVRNMYRPIPKKIWEISASSWFYYKNKIATCFDFNDRLNDLSIWISKIHTNFVGILEINLTAFLVITLKVPKECLLLINLYWLSYIVCIVTKLQAGRSRICFPLEARGFSLIRNVHTASKPHPASY